MIAPSPTVETPFSRRNPFPARLLTKRRLTLSGSEKETWYLDLSLRGSELSFEPGDSLGVFPSNSPALVEELLRALAFDPDAEVPGTRGGVVPLRAALLRDYTITAPSKQLLQAIAERSDNAQLLRELLQPDRAEQLKAYQWGRDVLDVVWEFPEARTRLSPQELVATLPKLQPRLYSIASSLKTYPDRAHLVVVAFRYETQGRLRKGVCSSFLIEQMDETTVAPVFVHVARHFRLPEDPSAPIIMVGPGTGVAPFRAFLQERQATGAKGLAWLIFGEQHRHSDFFFEVEWTGFLSSGALTRMDTAFSRDQSHKVYVQDRMREHARELWSWLTEGAYFYVCGDAERMAVGVDLTLRAIAQQQGGMTEEQAAVYVERLRKEKRYRRDVY